MNDHNQPATVHFHGGTKAKTLLTPDDLEEQGVDTYEELIEKALTEPTRPHWAWIGDVHVYTQAVSGIELADTTG